MGTVNNSNRYVLIKKKFFLADMFFCMVVNNSNRTCHVLICVVYNNDKKKCLKGMETQKVELDLKNSDLVLSCSAQL